MYYCYRLGIYPRQKPTVNWPEIRAQWCDNEQLCRELNFVHTHKFTDDSAVAEYHSQLEQQAKALREERKKCTRQLRHRNCHPSQINTLEARRAELTGTLKELRREDALAAVGASYSLTNVFICVAIGGGMGAAGIIERL